MANLGKKRGKVAREYGCLTGFGTALVTVDGDEVGIVAPSMRGLEIVWKRLNWRAPLDKTKVRRVVYFPHEALTTLRSRKPKQTAKAVEPK